MPLFLSALMALSITVWDTRPEPDALIAQAEVSEYYINAYARYIGDDAGDIEGLIRKVIRTFYGSKGQDHIKIEVRR